MFQDKNKELEEQIKKLDDKIIEFYKVFHLLGNERDKTISKLRERIEQLEKKLAKIEEQGCIINNYYYGEKQEEFKVADSCIPTFKLGKDGKFHADI